MDSVGGQHECEYHPENIQVMFNFTKHVPQESVSKQHQMDIMSACFDFQEAPCWRGPVDLHVGKNVISFRAIPN